MKPTRPPPPRSPPPHTLRRPRKVIQTARKKPKSEPNWWFDDERTMIAERDPDGIPLGIRFATPRQLASEGVSPKFMLLAGWAVVLAMTFYAAGDLRARVIHDDSLASMPALVSLTNGLYAVSSTLGPAKLREALDSVLPSLKQKTPELDPQLVEQEPGEDDFVPLAKKTPLPGETGQGAKKLRVLLVGAS